MATWAIAIRVVMTVVIASALPHAAFDIHDACA